MCNSKYFNQFWLNISDRIFLVARNRGVPLAATADIRSLDKYFLGGPFG